MGAVQDIRDILRGALAALAGFGGRMIARLVLMLTAGNLYGAAALGLLGQVAAITEILAAIAVLGLKRRLLDFLSEPAGKDKEASVIKAALVGVGVLSLLLSLLFGLLWPLMFPDTAMPTLLLAAIPAIVIAEVGGAAIRHRRIMRFEVIARCIMEPWVFLIAALGLFAAGVTETGLLAAYALSALAAATGILIGLHRAYGFSVLLSAPIQLAEAARILRRSLPTGITDIGTMMFRRADILLLSLVVGNDATGIYYMAQQIVTIPHKIHQLFEPMMAPVLASLHHGGKQQAIAAKLAGFCRWSFTLQLALTIPFAVFGAQLLGLFGDQFMTGALLLAVLLLAELCDGSFALTETALVFARPATPPKLILGALAVELVTVFGLSLLWGSVGAALGFLLAMASLAAGRLIMLWKHLGVRILGTDYLLPLGIGGFVGSGLLWVKAESGPLGADYFGLVLAGGLALYLTLVRMLALTPADRALLKQLRAG